MFFSSFVLSVDLPRGKSRGLIKPCLREREKKKIKKKDVSASVEVELIAVMSQITKQALLSRDELSGGDSLLLSLLPLASLFPPLPPPPSSPGCSLSSATKWGSDNPHLLLPPSPHPLRCMCSQTSTVPVKVHVSIEWQHFVRPCQCKHAQTHGHTSIQVNLINFPACI